MQRRTRKIITAIFAVATIAAVGFAVSLSFDPGNYFFYRPEDRAKWVYDPGSVAFVCILMLAEAFLTWVAFVAPRPQALWLRCFLGLALLGPWAVLSTMFVVHMPAYTLFHHLWVWLLVASLVLVAIASAIRRLHLRLRRGPPNNSFKPKSPRSGKGMA